MLLFGLMWIVSASIPHILFMLLSSFSKGSDDALIPGYIAMVQRAACNVVKQKECINLKAHEWQQIETIVRWKFDGINGRLQAFSLGVGALGLSGILALLFSQEEIRLWFRQFDEFMKMLGEGVIVEGVSIFLVLVMVGIAFLLAAIYFARSYIELRVLEAMGIICSLAASGFGVQQHSEQAEESASLSASAGYDLTAVPMPSAAPGSEASGSAVSSMTMTGASARFSGESFNAAPSPGETLATAEASPPCAAPASGAPDVAQFPEDSSSGIIDAPASSDTLNHPSAHTDHRS